MNFKIGDRIRLKKSLISDIFGNIISVLNGTIIDEIEEAFLVCLDDQPNTAWWVFPEDLLLIPQIKTSSTNFIH